jgi:DNA-binding MarR family transcriptional regulator
MARNCLATRVRMLSRTITRIYDAALRPHGLTISQLGILSVLHNLQPAPSNKVATYLSMEISTLSRNAHLMEGEGWITIERSEHGNGRVLSLTADGAEKLNEATSAWARAQEDAKALLGAEDAGTITQLVDRVWARQSGPSNN